MSYLTVENHACCLMPSQWIWQCHYFSDVCTFDSDSTTCNRDIWHFPSSTSASISWAIFSGPVSLGWCFLPNRLCSFELDFFFSLVVSTGDGWLLACAAFSLFCCSTADVHWKWSPSMIADGCSADSIGVTASIYLHKFIITQHRQYSFTGFNENSFL